MRTAIFTLVISAALSTIAIAGPGKPLVQGTFELSKIHTPDGKDVDLAMALVQGDTVWGRMAFTFDGNQLTVSSANLDHKDGRWTACEASLTTEVTWTRSGFAVAATVSTSGRFTSFKKLTTSDHDSSENHCSLSVKSGTYAVTAGAAPQLKKDGGTMFLAPTTETDKVDWSKHVR